MKILVICQYYYPEPFRINDICEELVRLGHDVTVVTGTPNYPMGNIYPGYENEQRKDEIINGVRVHRCTTTPRKTGVLNRIKNYLSYPIESIKYIKTLDNSYDVVFVNQLSPVIMAEAGIWYKNKYGKKLILYCLDLWPESICVSGIKRGSMIYNIFYYISKRVYNHADEILVTSRSFKSYINGMFRISKDKINYLPQYCESQFLELKEKKQNEKFNLLFAGNIGSAQGLDIIIAAAELLKNENIFFHIIGDGTDLQRIKKKAEHLKNIIFYGRKPLEELPKYYEMADAMLVTLIKDPIISLTLPGKVQSYMASGKAIIGAIDGETAIILNESQGGYCSAAENVDLFVKNIYKLRDSNIAHKIGKQNRDYYEINFSKENFISTLNQLLTVSKYENFND